MNFRIYKVLQYTVMSFLAHLVSKTIASSVEIKCTFEHQYWGFESFGFVYECEYKEGIEVTERNMSVVNVIGSHKIGETHEDVRGVHIIGASYLPKRIEKFFPNLSGLSVELHLKEITQNDLKPFPKLEHLLLARNQLEVIKKDLFEFNPNLVYISLKQNCIKEIFSTVFDNLNTLKILAFERNECISQNAIGRDAVLRLIKQSKENCSVTQATSTLVSSIIKREKIIYEAEIYWKNAAILPLCLLLSMAFGAIITLIIKAFRDNNPNVIVF